MNIRIKEESYEWLVAYSMSQCKTTLSKETPYWERYAITSYDQYEMMHSLYSVSYGEIVCGFAIVPKYKTNLLSSIYVSPNYRGKGIAPFVIDSLEIETLSCIAKNVGAMRSYEKIGFQIEPSEDSTNESLKLVRKL